MKPKKKSPKSNATQQRRRNSKGARSPGSASKKSAKSREEILKVRTPQNSKWLARQGIIVPDKLDPSDETVPLDFTLLGDREVGAVHSRFAVRQAHALYVRAGVATRLLRLKHAQRIALARYRAKYGKKFKTVKECEDAFLSDDGAEHQETIVGLEVKAVALDAAISGFDSIVKAASREMSRRDSERAPRD